MDRKERIIEEIQNSQRPISASTLAKLLHVSRQIIVGDIALLRASGMKILATPRGYVLERKANGLEKKVAVSHTRERMQEELYAIVDQGAEVLDVIVEHPTYGQIVASLQLSSRYEVDQFISKIEGNEPLSELTHGVHLHTIRCKDEDMFQRVQASLQEKGLLYRPET